MLVAHSKFPCLIAFIFSYIGLNLIMEKPHAFSLELLESKRIAVSFPYNDEIVSRLRALSDRKWDPAKKRWEVGVSHLHELLEIFNLQTSDVDRRILRCYQMYRIRDGRARITAGNVNAVLTGVSLPLDKIDRCTAFHIPGYKYMTRFKKGTWDGKRHLFKTAERCFPSGLASRVEKIVRDSGVDCDICWPDEPDTFNLSFPAEASRPPTALREYQGQCVEAGLTNRRGIFEVATGGGKTIIAAFLIRRICRPALFLVHTRDLMYQTISVLERELGIAIGCAGDGKMDIQHVTVATVQTCARALDIKMDSSPDDDEILETERAVQADGAEDLCRLIRTVPVVFFDECHHLPADTAYSLAMEMEGATWRYGLSATPYRADRQDLLMEAALGPKLFCARASFLIDLGYLVAPKIKFLPVPPLLPRSGKNDYQDVYSSYIVENRARNRLVAEAARQQAAEGKSVLVLVNHVRHGKLLSDMLGHVPLVQGRDDSDLRRKVFAALGSKSQLIVVATTLADEGLDIPSLDCVILAGAGRSETRALQRVGRALRTAPGKTGATIIDFMDNAPYLREHAANRLELFRTEQKFVVEY